MTLEEILNSCLYIDAHSHSNEYLNRNEMIKEVEENRILTLNAAMDGSSIKDAFLLNRDCPWILNAAGIHPWKAGDNSERTVEACEDYYARAVQISEIGMDSVWAPPEADPGKQEAVLEAQLFLAKKYRKPVTVHTKGAENQVLGLLKKCTPPAILVHWFDGTPSQLAAYLDLGCFFTVSPAILTNNDHLRLMKNIPLDRILPETDNPGTWPWLFQKPGRPLQIQDVIENADSLLNDSKGTLLYRSRENLRSFLIL